MTGFLCLDRWRTEDERKNDADIINEFMQSTLQLMDRYAYTASVIKEVQYINLNSQKDRHTARFREAVSRLVLASNAVIEKYLAYSDRELYELNDVSADTFTAIASIRPLLYKVITAFAIAGIDAFFDEDVTYTISKLAALRVYLLSRLGEETIQ